MPYTEAGVVKVVPVIDNTSENAWAFFKPWTWDLWLTILDAPKWTGEHFEFIIKDGKSRLPTDGKKLRIGVPVTAGFTEFVMVTKNPSTNTTDVTGFSIDVFKAAVELLAFALPFDFIPFAKPDGTSAGSYDDLCYQVYLGVKFLTISISFIQ
ncbi:hypothetical protein CerSpe_042950 [Prunus speciosa]